MAVKVVVQQPGSGRGQLSAETLPLSQEQLPHLSCWNSESLPSSWGRTHCPAAALRSSFLWAVDFMFYPLTGFLDHSCLRMTGRKGSCELVKGGSKGVAPSRVPSPSECISTCGLATADEGLDPMLGRSCVACFFPDTVH